MDCGHPLWQGAHLWPIENLLDIWRLNTSLRWSNGRTAVVRSGVAQSLGVYQSWYRTMQWFGRGGRPAGGVKTSTLSPLHVWWLRVALVLGFVLGVQQRAGLRGVLALQPVLVECLQGWVDLWKTQRQTAVGFLHLLHQDFVHSASRLALRLTSATQAPCEHKPGCAKLDRQTDFLEANASERCRINSNVHPKLKFSRFSINLN